MNKKEVIEKMINAFEEKSSDYTNYSWEEDGFQYSIIYLCGFPFLCIVVEDEKVFISFEVTTPPDVAALCLIFLLEIVIPIEFIVTENFKFDFDTNGILWADGFDEDDQIIWKANEDNKCKLKVVK